MTDTILLKRSTSDGTWSVAPTASVREPKYTLNAEGDLFRLVAARDVYDANGRMVVRAGGAGGLVFSETNLSHHGGCWVDWGAKVIGGAQVSGDARVSEESTVSGNARVNQRAYIGGSAVVTGNGQISGNARVWGEARVEGYLDDGAQAYDTAFVGYGWALAGNVTAGGRVRFNTADGQSCRITSGTFRGRMQMDSCRSFLVINTCWGPLTIAPCDRHDGWMATIGCQDVTTFEALQELADENGTPFEEALLPYWQTMVTEAIRRWENPSLNEEDDDDDDEDDD